MENDYGFDNKWRIANVPKINNGSTITIGSTIRQVTVIVDKHFIWFQKKMIKWCFGFDVSDYSDND